MRRMNVKLGLVLGLSACALATSLLGCNTKTDTTKDSADVEPAVTAKNAAGKATDEGTTADAPGVRLERALRALDRGGQASDVKTELEGVLHDGAATLDEQDEARIGLSRAREALGDKDGAISAVEELLAAHPESARFAAREPAEKRLRLLLTGTESDKASVTAPEKFAPIAKELATYFHADDHGETLIDVLAIGRNGQHLEDLGGLSIPAAKRDALRQACSFCDDNLKVFQSMSRTGSWVDIPRMSGEIEAGMPQIDRSLVIVYFDLESDRVPSRYDEYLALPSADVVARLEKGEGLIAVRERKGSKPTILIAAPRTGELPQVQEAFAKLTSLPKEPVSVPLDSHLAPEEIQGVVRASFGDIKQCYNMFLQREPTVQGSILIKFDINADGTVKNVGTDEGKPGSHTTLTDPTLTECISGVFTKLQFANTGHPTSVGYPLAFSP